MKKTAESASNYFPGCRKDANCTCEICLASINATLDLLPEGSSTRTLQKSSVTFSSTPQPKRRLIAPLKPPEIPPDSPALHSTAKSRAPPRKHKENPLPNRSPRFSLFLALILTASCGFVILRNQTLGGALLTTDFVKKAGERARMGRDLREKLISVENYLVEIVGAGRVCNCSGGFGWEIQQDGHLLISKCVMYISATEEVSVWGFPIQISRTISTGFSSRWLTVLTGRLTEWSREHLLFEELRPGGYYGRWETGIFHLEIETWVLEYRASWLENWTDVVPRLVQLLRAWIPSPWCAERLLSFEGDSDALLMPS